MVLPDKYRKNASVNNKVIGKMKNELNKGHIVNLLLCHLKYMHTNKLKLIKHFQKIKKQEIPVNVQLKRP